MRTKSQLNKQAKHSTFYKFEEGISFAEHWKLVAESSEFNLTLKRAHRVHFCQLEIRQKKRDILSEKRESGMALKKLEFTPESGTVDTYGYGCALTTSLILLDLNINFHSKLILFNIMFIRFMNVIILNFTLLLMLNTRVIT